MIKRRGAVLLGTMLVGLVLLHDGAGRVSAAPPTGGTVQEKLDALARLPGPARQRLLEAEAIKEGKVVLYDGDPALVRAWNAGFKQRYPQIDVQFVRQPVAVRLQKVMQESQAGHPAADLVHVTAAELPILERAGLVARYQSPETQAFYPEFRDPQALWSVYWYDPLVTAFNTDRLKRAQIPTTLEGLANPALAGKLALVSAGSPNWIAGILKAKGEPAGLALVKQLAAHQPRLFDNHTALGNALASGQVELGVLLLEIGARNRALGAPVDWVVPDPLFLLPGYQVLLKDAPHPYAAALAYDWLLSREGQAVYKPAGTIGPRKDTEYAAVQADAMRAARQSGTQILSLSAELMADSDRYVKLFEDLFVRH
jgi:iron(III) transport system substrate-binding protein